MAEQSLEDHISITIKLLQRPFKKMMTDFNDRPLSIHFSIFRIPKILSRHNPGAYEPNGFSFGPFHYGKEQLKPTQNIKWKYMQGLLRRSGLPEEEKYKQLIESITLVQKEARQCYGGVIETCDEEEFVEILVLDGCFIIELFRKDAGKIPKENYPDDPIFTMSFLEEFLSHDLILLENQIPWLVLERLFGLTKVSEDESLIELTLHFFKTIFSYKKPSVTENKFHERRIVIKHILDLLRHSLLLPLSPEKFSEKALGWKQLPSATKLKQAGIKFEKGMGNTILDINFKNGVLKIPTLVFEETTGTILLNLISFEQCCPCTLPIVTSYARFMDSLIDTEEDVEILSENKIIDNWLKPEDAKQVLNILHRDKYVTPIFYHDICHRVNIHRKRWWPRCRFFYLHNFTTPWALVSQVVGVILLILAFLQTLYSILGVVQNKKG